MFTLMLDTAADSLAASIPSLTNRVNFALPVIVVLLIVMFFLLIKVYAIENEAPGRSGRKPPAKKGRGPKSVQ